MAQKHAPPTIPQPDQAQQAPEGSAHALADALAIANRLRPVLLRLHRALRTEAHELGVTSTQASLLAAITRSPNIGLGELAAQEHLTSPTLVNHIDKLEAAGFVERMRCQSPDRRRVEITITAAGTEVLETLRERRTAWLAAHLEQLTSDDLATIAAAIEPLNQLVRQPA
ncbi:MAG TPA: MarR family transcriptional regulator [Ktedonobacterales bacterium]